MALDDKQTERLNELRAKQTAREHQAQGDADAQELEALELVETLEADGGRDGVDLKVLRNRLGGVFGIRKPDSKANRVSGQASEKQKMQEEWQIGVLRHYILPTEKSQAWAVAATERSGLIWQTASAFVDLMSVDRSVLDRK